MSIMSIAWADGRSCTNDVVGCVLSYAQCQLEQTLGDKGRRVLIDDDCKLSNCRRGLVAARCWWVKRRDDDGASVAALVWVMVWVLMLELALPKWLPHMAVA